jgi:hypothetical protein
MAEQRLDLVKLTVGFMAQLNCGAPLTVNPPVIVFDGWRFTQTSNATGAHEKCIWSE